MQFRAIQALRQAHLRALPSAYGTLSSIRMGVGRQALGAEGLTHLALPGASGSVGGAKGFAGVRLPTFRRIVTPGGI